VGKVVTITDIAFSDNKIEVELDNGGKKDKKWYERIEVGMGSRTTPVSRDDAKKPPQGSKIILKFAQKVPADITPDQLRDLLNPVLDFNAQNFMKTGIASLPPEFQEAVKAKEARIGMDKNTVRMALGRQNHTTRDNDENGNPQETWIYQGRGTRATFIWFQNDVVVKIAHFSAPDPQ
jgi:hypothetical protein